jgi:hypothetical protein
MNPLDKMKELVGMGSSRASSSSESREISTLVPHGTSVKPQHNTIVYRPLETRDSNQSSAHDTAIDSDSSDSVITVIGSSVSATIADDTSPSPSKAFTRGHRRRSTHVTRRDLEKFQSEVLGVENHASWFDEDNGTPRSFTPDDPQLEELNRAFADADVSLNTNSTNMASNGTGSGNYSGYVESSMGQMNVANMPPRQPPSPSPTPSHSSVIPQINGGGMGAMGAGHPMNAGHQMDLHHLYEMVGELSDVLKHNRDVAKNIVANAEEIAVCELN